MGEVPRGLAARATVLARDHRVGFAVITLLFLLMLRGLFSIREKLGPEGGAINVLIAGVVAVYAVGAALYLAYMRRR